MTVRVQRILLALLALSAAFVAFWAVTVPRSFYDSFPALGRHWVDVDGPYNEHLVRDVGGLYLALFVLSVGALWLATPQIVRLTGASWLVFNIAHFLYHAAHLGPLDNLDAALEMLALGLSLLAAAALLLPQRRSATMRLPESKR
jgi:hypothetical protein